MRNHTTPNTYELTSEGGGKTIAITPGTTGQPGKFLISGVDPFVSDARNYITKFISHLNIVLDPDATGSAFAADCLWKGVTSIELISPLIGTQYPHIQSRGAVMGYIVQCIALNYWFPQGARTQIPTNTDTDVTIDTYYVVPLVHECLLDPMDTAQWSGLYDGGSLETIVAPSTVFDGDYAGLVTKTGTLRALCETLPMDREQLGIPFQWRERQISGGGSSPVLKAVGGETSLNGVQAGCGLALLYWLTDATGLGLGGPDGVDNITAIGLQWRSQKQIQNLDNYFIYLRNAMEKRTGPVAGLGTTIINDNAGWPTTMVATTTVVDNRPAANSQQGFLPIITPGRDLKTSNLQRVLGDLQVDFQVTSAITSTHRFVSWELMEWTDSQITTLASAARFSGAAMRRGLNGQDSNNRYAPIVFGK